MEAKHFKFWPDGVPRTIEIPDRSIHANLEASAAQHPGKPAIVFYGASLSYSELKGQVDLVAGFLQQRCAVRKGDRVLLNMQNCPQFIIAYYAILRAGAMVVPVNPMNLTGELRHFVADSDARTMLTAQELYPLAAPLLQEGVLDHIIVASYAEYAGEPASEELPEVAAAAPEEIIGPGVVLWRDALAAQLPPEQLVIHGSDKCVMPYTSGTTGQPKGCVHTHSTVMSTILAGALWISTEDDARVLATLPLFHVTGMQSSMNGPLYRGSTIVLMTRWDRDIAARLIQRHRISAWTNIATMAIDFLANPELHRYDISSLKNIGGGGAAMPQSVAQRLKELTGLTYVEGYGLSETMAPTHINPPSRAKQQCLGIPICSTDSRVIDPDTLAQRPPGEVGEIVSSGPQLFLGYWKNPEATAAAFIELDAKRFFRTGDLGYCDPDGYFFLVDRLKRMINASGFKVWPAEVESMLYAHPDIHEVCVIGSRDARRGETVKAVVVLRDTANTRTDGASILKWAREHMAAYKVPRVIEFARSLPKSATGKIRWRLLQDQENQRTDRVRT